ncbi:aldose 1-epimerase [Klebsormidium nitens]|uniref:Aldose 1-epimerase n=1 Tax=Klebsormidium nitens TaxID=105231 RepID=A0A1Y1IE66_KLENI|nr:aldose 1-epimerase [Klebsormidium nitens]|eukprot:GAQ86996.1 aldose 1-epimerase [Klebsormidium nitens]
MASCSRHLSSASIVSSSGRFPAKSTCVASPCALSNVPVWGPFLVDSCTRGPTAVTRKPGWRRESWNRPVLPTTPTKTFFATAHRSRSGGSLLQCNAASVEIAESSNDQGASEPEAAIQSIPELRERFRCPGVEFQEVSGLRVAVLKLAEGSSVRVLLEGARVIAWRAVMYHKGKEDLIYSKLNRTRAEGQGWLRGGIPVSFPEPAEGAAGIQSSNSLASLVREMPWRVVSTWADGDAFAEIVLSLEDTPATRALWPHRFALRYSVHQLPDRLVCVLRCHNRDARPFSFGASLDSHLEVVDPAGATVMGLEGAKYVTRTKLNRNWKAKGAEKQQDVPLGKSTERIYCKPQAAVSLFDRGGYRTMTLVKEGFEDVVLVDSGSSTQESSFLCLGAGNHRKITLAPGESWEGRQTIRLEK